MSSSLNLPIHPQPRFALASIWLAMFVLASLGARAQSPEASTVLKDAEAPLDLSAYVSPDLDGLEQAVVRSTLKNLPRSLQEDIASKPSNVTHLIIVDGGTGMAHYSHPEDADTFTVKPNPGMPGDENPFTANGGLDPGVYGGSGPYRRVYTTPVPGLTQPAPTVANDLIHQHFYLSVGDVSIACNMGSFASGDVGYSYMGGWSGDWNSLSGSNAEADAVDAGLQYSPKNNNYALIMAIAKAGIITVGNYKGAALAPRIQCTNKNTWAEISFGAFGAYQTPTAAPSCWQISTATHTENFIGFPQKACNTYALMLSVGSDQFVGHIGSIVIYKLIWYSPNYQYGGWGELEPLTVKYYNGVKDVSGWLPRVSCANCAFKWMTSIAQKKENLTDKSWYAAGWFGHRLIEAGTGKTAAPVPASQLNCTEYPLWEAAYPSKYSQDCRNTPAGLKGVQPSVAVSKFTSQNEVDLIDLKY